MALYSGLTTGCAAVYWKGIVCQLWITFSRNDFTWAQAKKLPNIENKQLFRLYHSGYIERVKIQRPDRIGIWRLSQGAIAIAQKTISQ